MSVSEFRRRGRDWMIRTSSSNQTSDGAGSFVPCFWWRIALVKVHVADQGCGPAAEGLGRSDPVQARTPVEEWLAKNSICASRMPVVGPRFPLLLIISTAV